MILRSYWSGKTVSLVGYWWAKSARFGTRVLSQSQDGRIFRVSETAEEIERLDHLDDERLARLDRPAT